MKTILRVQAAYYIATGIFPLVSMDAFERVTGRKKDRWLVRMVGLLATSIGMAVAAGTCAEEVDGAIPLLAITSALSFAGIDLIYVVNGTISPVYLADAAIEMALAAAVLAACISTGDDDDTRRDA